MRADQAPVTLTRSEIEAMRDMLRGKASGQQAGMTALRLMEQAADLFDTLLKQEPVAEVAEGTTYSDYTAVPTELLVIVPFHPINKLPLGTKLYAAPKPEGP